MEIHTTEKWLCLLNLLRGVIGVHGLVWARGGEGEEEGDGDEEISHGVVVWLWLLGYLELHCEQEKVWATEHLWQCKTNTTYRSAEDQKESKRLNRKHQDSFIGK